jgi:hypothetical protein
MYFMYLYRFFSNFALNKKSKKSKKKQKEIELLLLLLTLSSISKSIITATGTAMF